MMLSGPDCSRHQGVVDWAKVRAAGHRFAIIKLTDGLRYRYVAWGRENLPKVRAAGLVPGAYHWLYGPQDGAAQARVYVDEVNRLGGFDGLLAVVDVERDDDGSVPSYADVQAFSAEFKRLVPGHPLIIYTGRWFWRDILGDFPGAVIGPLWHSEYEPSLAEVEDGPELDSYGGWSHATLWQFTSSATVPGVSGNCDLNRFFGTYDDLLALAGSTPAPEPPKEQTMYIADLASKPALVVGLAGVQQISKVQRDTLRSFGVEAHPVNAEQYDGLWALRSKPLDPAVFADAVIAKLPAGSTDAAALKTAVREGLAEVELTGGHFVLAES